MDPTSGGDSLRARFLVPVTGSGVGTEKELTLADVRNIAMGERRVYGVT